MQQNFCPTGLVLGLFSGEKKLYSFPVSFGTQMKISEG